MSNVFINIVFTWPTFGPRVVDTVMCPRSNFYSYLRHFNIDYFTFYFTSDIIMSNGVTVKRWTYDNAQRHVTAFRPISEAAHSWSDDNTFWSIGFAMVGGTNVRRSVGIRRRFTCPSLCLSATPPCVDNRINE